MRVVPIKHSEKIEWCEQRVAPWTANVLAIGSSAPEVTAFDRRPSSNE